MRNASITLYSAAATVAALGMTGCTRDHSQADPGPVPSASPVVAPPVDPGPPPPAEALSDVLARLADPALPGTDKVALVQDTAPQDAGALERFSAALRDTGFAPVAVSATDVRWVDGQPGDALATIKLTSANPDTPGEFAFPMEFHHKGDRWQLTRETADMLLAFGNAATGPPPPVPPAPAPPR